MEFKYNNLIITKSYIYIGTTKVADLDLPCRIKDVQNFCFSVKKKILIGAGTWKVKISETYNNCYKLGFPVFKAIRNK